MKIKEMDHSFKRLLAYLTNGTEVLLFLVALCKDAMLEHSTTNADFGEEMINCSNKLFIDPYRVTPKLLKLWTHSEL